MQVISPFSAEDCRGLLKAAIRDNDPVVFLENELLYGLPFQVSDEVLDPNFVLPIGKAKVERAGEKSRSLVQAFDHLIKFKANIA